MITDLDGFMDLEKDITNITLEIQELSNQNVTDELFMADLQESPDDCCDTQWILEVYKEAGLILPDQVTKRFEDVLEFHEAVTANHKLHMADEIIRIQKRLNNRRTKVERLLSQVDQMRSALHEASP